VTSADIRYCGGSTPAACDGKTGEIKIEAVVTCKGGNAVLDTKTYNVVPDPTVTGTCAWDTRNNTFLAGAVARVSSAAPTTNDSYGRCDAAPSFFVNNTKKSSLTTGLTVDSWTGGDANDQPMTGIAIGVACGDRSYTVPCPNITVRNPDKPEYTLEIGSSKSTTKFLPELVEGVGYTILTMASPCQNVRFGTNYQQAGSFNSPTSIKVNDSTPIACSDATNNNCSNVVVTPKPAVGNVIVVTNIAGFNQLTCDNW